MRVGPREANGGGYLLVALSMGVRRQDGEVKRLPPQARGSVPPLLSDSCEAWQV